MIKRFVSDLGLSHDQLVDASSNNTELLFALIDNGIIQPTEYYIQRYIVRNSNGNDWYSDAFTQKIFDGIFDIKFLNSLNVGKLNLVKFTIPENLKDIVLKLLYEHHVEHDTVYILLYTNERKYKHDNAVMIHDYINTKNSQPSDNVGHSQAYDYEYIRGGGDLEHSKLSFKNWTDFSIFNDQKYQIDLIKALSYKIAFNLEYKDVLQMMLDQLGMSFIEKLIAVEPYTYTSILYDNLNIPSHTNNTKLFVEHVFTNHKVIAEIMSGVYDIGRLINFESVKNYMFSGEVKKRVIKKYRNNMTDINNDEIVELYTKIANFELSPLFVTISDIKNRCINTGIIDYFALANLDINKYNSSAVVDFIIEFVEPTFIEEFIINKTYDNFKNVVGYNNQLRLVEYNINMLSLFI